MLRSGHTQEQGRLSELLLTSYSCFAMFIFSRKDIEYFLLIFKEDGDHKLVNFILVLTIVQPHQGHETINI